jgi:hypothetical protein
MGDNITPPQQAFNWVADVYGSTAEIKARGQVIVGLLHEDIGHLGIFVSGKVAKKEHAQIVSVLEAIEGLPPGLYGMAIEEHRGANGQPEYEVEFRERRLEDVVAQINRFGRVDEKPFEAVAEVSQLNQRAYEVLVRPMVQATSNEGTAALLRAFHPLRMQNWALSHFNPWMAWLAPAAQAVDAARRPMAEDHPLRQAERHNADAFSAWLDYGRAVRDALTEAAFFMTYANMAPAEGTGAEAVTAESAAGSGRDTPVVREALASIAHGGYVEALARVALLQRQGEPLPLSRLELRKELLPDYQDYLPGMSPHDWRRVRGEQEIIARHEPEAAVQTLALLLDEQEDRERLVTLLDKLMADKRLQAKAPTAAQKAMLGRIRETLEIAPRPARRGSTTTTPRRRAASVRRA